MALSNNKQIQCSHVINPREIAAWVLVVILVVLLIVSLVIIGMLAVWVCSMYRRSNKPNDASPDCALAMDSNPCYEASNVKQIEAHEAVHVYDTVKQHS